MAKYYLTTNHRQGPFFSPEEVLREASRHIGFSGKDAVRVMEMQVGQSVTLAYGFNSVLIECEANEAVHTA